MLYNSARSKTVPDNPRLFNEIVGTSTQQRGKTEERPREGSIAIFPSSSDMVVLFIGASRAQQKLHKFTDTLFGKGPAVPGATFNGPLG